IFFFQAEDGIRDFHVTGVQTCALPISAGHTAAAIDEMAVDLARTTNASVSEVGDVATALLAYTSITGESFRRVLQLSQDLAEARSEERRVGSVCGIGSLDQQEKGEE